MKIYTKTGDRGETSLASGQRVGKSCQRLETYGTIDELNSHVGLLQCQCTEAATQTFLSQVQCWLFVVGGNLASAADAKPIAPSLQIDPQTMPQLEQEIDRLQAMLQPLRRFVLPGGCHAAAQAHVCRTVCRRAEREIVRLRETGATVDDNVLALVNRLSDYFFVLSRQLNLAAGMPDVEW